MNMKKMLLNVQKSFRVDKNGLIKRYSKVMINETRDAFQWN